MNKQKWRIMYDRKPQETPGYRKIPWILRAVVSCHRRQFSGVSLSGVPAKERPLGLKMSCYLWKWPFEYFTIDGASEFVGLRDFYVISAGPATPLWQNFCTLFCQTHEQDRHDTNRQHDQRLMAIVTYYCCWKQTFRHLFHSFLLPPL